jgi:diguanylate cyclase (GGDEF)-like protein
MTSTRGPTGSDPTAGARSGSLASRLSPSTPVLVIEDEHDIAKFLRAYFRASGQEVVHVDPVSPEQVAEAVTEHRPACVLLDLHLRGFDGLDAYRCIRDGPAGASVPVVIVTADHAPAVRRQAMAGGVDAFVTKPFKVDELCQLVVELVRRAGPASEAGGPDDVTGAGSHAYLQERLADEVAVAQRTRKPVSFAVVRLCSLPAINQQGGNDAGDFALREVARRLLDALPASTVVGRNAGDEFGMILPGTGPAEAGQVAEAALLRAAEPVAVPGVGEVQVVLRGGVACYPDHADNHDELYMAADSALVGACDSDQLVSVAL